MSDSNDKPDNEVEVKAVSSGSPELPSILAHLRKAQQPTEDRIKDINEYSHLQELANSKDGLTSGQVARLEALQKRMCENSKSQNGIGFGDSPKKPNGNSR